MKRLTAAIIVLFMLVINICAASAVIVDMPDKAVLVDDQYHVTVSISENPGFASVQLELYYNSDVINCVKVVPGGVVKGMLFDSNPSVGSARKSAILSVAGISNTTLNGNIATFVFDIVGEGDPEFDFDLVELRGSDGRVVDCKLEVNNKYVSSYIPDKPEPDDDKPGVIVPGNPEPDNPIVVPTITFSDVGKAHWANVYISEAVALGIVSGYTDGTFLPDKEMTRAEFATLLWNLENRPLPAKAAPFADVGTDDWFFLQIAWAYEKGYINGVSATEFNPNGTITREQAMTILYRYSGSPAMRYVLDRFEDQSDVSLYAFSALNWAVDRGILSGVDSMHLAPRANATRAQLAAIIVRYIHFIK